MHRWPVVRVFYVYYKPFLYSVGDYQAALTEIEEFMKVKKSLTGIITFYHGLLYYGLLLAKIYPDTRRVRKTFGLLFQIKICSETNTEMGQTLSA